MKPRLQRWYGLGHLHFITCSCYHRMPALDTPQMRDLFLKILDEVRQVYDFALIGYVVMPEHIHLLISEPNVGNPSLVMKTLKERVSRTVSALREEAPSRRRVRVWQKRFYDFNVWSPRKKNEKLNYMHFNPVKRGLVKRPDEWLWSSCRFYGKGERGLCAPNPEWRYKGKTRMLLKNEACGTGQRQ